MSWFKLFTSQDDCETVEEVERELLDRSLELYNNQRRLEIDTDLLEVEKDLMLKHSKDYARKNIELAKLDAEIEFKKQLLDSIKDESVHEKGIIEKYYQALVKDKDSIIELLKTQVEVLTAKLCDDKVVVNNNGCCANDDE